MRDVIFFIIALLAPFIYWRAMFVWAKKFAEKPRLVGKTGIQIHHLHHGILLIFLAAAGLLFLGKNTWVILVLGLGLGMVLDEFISSLMLPEDRPFGLAL